MEDLELLSAAHHEAGHIVVAHSLNCRVDGLEVFWSDLERWFGSSPMSLSKENLDPLQKMMQMASLSVNGAKAAVAGMLAQTKFLASQQIGEEVHFDASADLREMVAFLRDNKRTEESQGCVVIGFLLGSSGDVARIEFSRLCFSTADSKGFNYYLAHSEGSNPETLVKETMQLIDNEATWMEVKKLASLVLSQPPTGDDKRRSLSAAQILDALPTQA